MNNHTVPNSFVLSNEENSVEAIYLGARRVITELHRQLDAQHRYIEELERQLEPSVIAEIRQELSQQP